MDHKHVKYFNIRSNTNYNIEDLFLYGKCCGKILDWALEIAPCYEAICPICKTEFSAMPATYHVTKLKPRKEKNNVITKAL